jgi:hypothetical protein
MAQESIVFRALRQQMLWPPLHAAVDVYQRRRSAGADHFELIWRLIHICECVVVTIAGAAISRLRALGRQTEFLKLREKCYGLTWNDAEVSFDKGIAALDGSIDKWIEIIQYVSSLAAEDSQFLLAVKEFLSGPSAGTGADCTPYRVDTDPLLRAWGRACDVPPGLLPDKVAVKDAFRVINSFRNRFAHVPFPYDQIQEIYRALEMCVFRLFEVPPSGANDQSPLSGIVAYKDAVLRGAGHNHTPDDWPGATHAMYVWGKKGSQERWDARPFLFVDQMMRPFLLSRLKNEEGAWEYTRYLAEANAVYNLSDPGLLQLLARPDESEYKKYEVPHPATETAKEAPEAPNAKAMSREDAITASKGRNFVPAIEYFQGEVDRAPEYHSGWQRLGYAQREYGVGLLESDPKEAEEMLRRSIDSFGRAVGHTVPQYAAQAYYNRSKSNWRLWRLRREPLDYVAALDDSAEAARRYDDPRFASWYEFLRDSDRTGSVREDS